MVASDFESKLNLYFEGRCTRVSPANSDGAVWDCVSPDPDGAREIRITIRYGDYKKYAAYFETKYSKWGDEYDELFEIAMVPAIHWRDDERRDEQNARDHQYDMNLIYRDLDRDD